MDYYTQEDAQGSRVSPGRKGLEEDLETINVCNTSGRHEMRNEMRHEMRNDMRHEMSIKACQKRRRAPEDRSRESDDDVSGLDKRMLNAQVGPGWRAMTGRRQEHISIPSLCREHSHIAEVYRWGRRAHHLGRDPGRDGRQPRSGSRENTTSTLLSRCPKVPFL